MIFIKKLGGNIVPEGCAAIYGSLNVPDIIYTGAWHLLTFCVKWSVLEIVRKWFESMASQTRPITAGSVNMAVWASLKFREFGSWRKKTASSNN